MRACEHQHMLGRTGVEHADARLTYALVVVHLVAGRADAPEGSVQVLTGSRRAGSRQAQALVDV